MLWRKTLSKDECITAWVALQIIRRCLDNNQEPVLTPGAVVVFELDHYGIRIPEKIARNTLKKLTSMGVLERSGEKYILTDIATVIIRLSYYALKGADKTEEWELAMALALMIFGKRRLEKIATTLKSVTVCGGRALKELFESTQPQLHQSINA
jgi:hypothetical protein